MIKFMEDETQLKPLAKKAHLFLVYEREGGVSVKAKTELGNIYNILYFKNDGTLSRTQFVSENIGFQVDGAGRIILSQEEK